MNAISNLKKAVAKAQRGFTIVELMIVLGIIAVLAVIGLPMVQNIAIEGRAPEVAKAIQQSIVKLVNNRQNGGDWSAAATPELVSVLTGNTVLKVVTGGTPSVAHDLNKSGTTGTITFGPATISTANDGGKITLAAIDGVACPIVSNALSKVSATMKIGTTDVKTTSSAYNGGLAQTTCVETGNTIEIQFR